MIRKNNDRHGYITKDQTIETIYQLHDNDSYSSLSSITIASQPPIPVQSYRELMTRIAYLSQGNPRYKLLFRGQKSDHQRLDTQYESHGMNSDKTRQKSSLIPTLARQLIDLSTGKLRDPFQIMLDGLEDPVSLESFETNYFSEACNNIAMATSIGSGITFWNAIDEVQQLAMLQHYEIIPTLMFDLTSELTTALSFGFNEINNKCYLYVFGVPYRGEAISIFPEENLMTIDLARLLPPEALRPHFQSGYMLAAHPNAYQKIEGFIYGYKTSYTSPRTEDWDFSRLLLAKFEITEEFWQSEFVPKLRSVNYYYPDNDDLMFELANETRNRIGLVEAKPHSL